MTPYEVTYGKPPSSIPQYLPGTSSVEVVNFLQASRQEVFQLLRKKLERTQEQMKKVVDAHRRDTTFVVGDWVYVKLRPYR